MANINVVVDRPIADGYKLKFRTPCDSTVIEGLDVKYPANNGVGTLIKKFVFKDAHGTELSGVGNLFVSGVMIEVLLDVTHSVAYIKNADTNSYVESVKGDVQRLEESQKQFLSVAGKIVDECERATEEMGLAYEDIVRGGHIENLKEQNNGGVFSVWVGDMEQYDELPEKESNRLYVITHDIPGEGYDNALAANTAAIEENANAIDTNTSAIAENSTAIAENAAAIEENANAITANRNSISGVQNAIVINRNGIDALQNTVSEMQRKMNASVELSNMTTNNNGTTSWATSGFTNFKLFAIPYEFSAPDEDKELATSSGVIYAYPIETGSGNVLVYNQSFVCGHFGNTAMVTFSLRFYKNTDGVEIYIGVTVPNDTNTYYGVPKNIIGII